MPAEYREKEVTNSLNERYQEVVEEEVSHKEASSLFSSELVSERGISFS